MAPAPVSPLRPPRPAAAAGAVAGVPAACAPAARPARPLPPCPHAAADMPSVSTNRTSPIRTYCIASRSLARPLTPSQFGRKLLQIGIHFTGAAVAPLARCLACLLTPLLTVAALAALRFKSEPRPSGRGSYQPAETHY